MCATISLHTTQVFGVIPARLASTRLPRKVLREIAGKPMLAWVVQSAAKAGIFDRLIVATDAEEVAELCRAQGWEVRLTSSDLPSGTDRVHAVAQQLMQEDVRVEPNDIFVNIQGDEPLLRPEHFRALLHPFQDTEAVVSTVMSRCPTEDISNPNAVKVVVDRTGKALYFSRATIPHDRDGRGDNVIVWKHLGLYAYRKHILDRFPSLPASQLEMTERLEQLRLLDNGISIYVEPVELNTIGVDTEADLKMASAALARLAEERRVP